MNEIDLLVASPWGVFLIEIKSWPGKLSGDSYNWTCVTEDGRRFTEDNPVLLANRKCKRLKDLLGRQPSFRNRDVPFIQALVFCSAPNLVLQLPPDARNFVCLRDTATRQGGRAAIYQRQCPGLRPATERLVDGPTLKAFCQAMAQAGLRRQRRRVGDFVLDHLRYESPAGVFQDWEAHHSTSESVRRLVRIYLTALQATKDDREAVADAANREFHTLARLSHPGILRAQVPATCELGPAIVFEFDATAQRLDHFLAENRAQLDVGARLEILRQITDAIRYAHDKDVVHRALGPQAIYVTRDKAGQPRVQIYNWHTGARLPDGSFSGLTNLTASIHAAQLVEEPARAYIAPESLTPSEEPAEAMDVFSLGALAYFLFGDQPPAADATELLEKLKASARALLVKKGDVRCVLKVARDASFNRRLDQEFQTLKKLGSPNIVKAFERYELNGLTAFTVELAGERTLARMLKEDGPPDLELLQRYGEELITAVEHLDKEGIFHRDIKPENIGIGESGGARASKRLRLFDFSLAAAAPTELRVGTLDYLDPFLGDRKARRYDLGAELYSVAMTMHEMATGERAKWKGGQPQLTTEEITQRSELFDADLRDQFTNFFRTALNRDYRKRFDNTREMLRAWSAIFETVDRPTAHSEHDRPQEAVLSEEVLKYATPATQIGSLMLSTRLMNVLERLGVHSIEELLRFKFGRFEKFRGVGRKTQLELIKVMHRLRQAFPGVEMGQGEPVVSVAKAVVGQETIDVLAQHALLVSRSRAREAEIAVIHPFLGWGVAAGQEQVAWPSQSDLAQTGGVTRQRIGQIITTARERWSESVPLAGLRGAIAEVLRGRGGVMTHVELVAHVLSIRSSAENDPRKIQLASAAVRASVEAEHISETPRFDEYRSGEKIFIALHSELRNYAVKLGRIADDLAILDPLPTPARVLDELRAVPFPDDVPNLSPPVEARLRQLAVAAATNADLSSRGEIYPPGLPAERALPLARNGLFGEELTIKEIQRRLCARFPRCGALPPRPQLDDVLRDAGFDLEWQPLAADQQGAYKSTRAPTLSSSVSIGSRKPTQYTVLPGSATEPEIAQAATVEKRLRSSANEGGYLILTVEPGQLELAQRELTARFDVEVCDLDELFLEALHAEAEAEDVRADWDTVLAADSAARDSTDWRNLQYLVERALPKVERRLRGVRKTCLALHPGLLARYGHMNLIASLAADIGRAGGPGGLWVLAPANDSHTLPTVSGVPIPVTSPNQHTRLTIHWLRNEHRAGVPVGK